jgi:hypothetical protein
MPTNVISASKGAVSVALRFRCGCEVDDCDDCDWDTFCDSCDDVGVCDPLKGCDDDWVDCCDGCVDCCDDCVDCCDDCNDCCDDCNDCCDDCHVFGKALALFRVVDVVAGGVGTGFGAAEEDEVVKADVCWVRVVCEAAEYSMGANEEDEEVVPLGSSQ